MITLQLVSPHFDSFPESTTGKPNRGRTTGLYGNQWHLGRENVCGSVNQGNMICHAAVCFNSIPIRALFPLAFAQRLLMA